MNDRKYQICTNCVMDTTDPEIKFDENGRCDFSSLILTGQMTRQAAVDALKQPPYDESTAMQDLDYILDKLGMDKAEFMRLMNGEKRTFRDYRNNERLLKSAIKLAMPVGIEKSNFR